jgi:hypothetical protein
VTLSGETTVTGTKEAKGPKSVLPGLYASVDLQQTQHTQFGTGERVTKEELTERRHEKARQQIQTLKLLIEAMEVEPQDPLSKAKALIARLERQLEAEQNVPDSTQGQVRRDASCPVQPGRRGLHHHLGRTGAGLGERRQPSRLEL